MVAVLSRLTKFGMAPEATAGTYVAPTFFPPFDPGTLNVSYDQPPLRDESIRNNDSLLQGLYLGQRSGGFGFTMNAYPIESGHLLRGIIGPDTVTAAPGSTTLTGATATAGTNAVAGTVALTANSVIIVNAGNSTQEIRYVVTATTVNQNWVYTHAAGETVTYLTKHLFQQGTGLSQPKTYSGLIDDTVQPLQLTYARLASLGCTIDTTGIVKFKPAYRCFFPAVSSTQSPTYPTAQPMLGWQWLDYYAATLAPAGINTSYQMCDVNLTREIDTLWGSDGTQDPRELFAADMAATGKKTKIYENNGSNTDAGWVMFRDQVQTTAAQSFVGTPFGGGGALLITFSKPGVTTFDPTWGKKYLEASYDLEGIANTTDAGQISVTLWNTQTTAF